MARSSYWSVEDVQRSGVTMESDGGSTARFPRAAFPKTVRAGMVFRFTGKKFVRDSAEEHKRLIEARATLQRLRASDPGGDIIT